MTTTKEKKLRYRFYTEQLTVFVDVDQEKRTIRSAELEGELPLLVVNPVHRTASLWMLNENLIDECGFDAVDYTYDEEMGINHVWKWYDENGNTVLRVVAHYPAENEEDEIAQLVVYLEDQDGLVQMEKSLLLFMTDFKGWTFAETYGDVSKALTALGRYLTEKQEKEEE